MAPSSTFAVSRRKSGNKGGLTVTLHVASNKLRDIVEPVVVSKEDSPVKDVVKESQDSPATSATLAAPASNGENVSDSNPGTPAGSGTPAPSVMGPPTESVKKKGGKRSAAAAADGTPAEPKVRGKPGPKKKPRLEDGSIDPNSISAKVNGAGAAKLGPKANQGAINAGLRALDRSGKPCRKWAKGGFTLKTFTGVVWEIPRWTAPPNTVPESATEESAEASADSSTKENKENNSQIKSDANSNTNSGLDVEMRSVASINPSSPAPIAIAAAS